MMEGLGLDSFLRQGADMNLIPQNPEPEPNVRVLQILDCLSCELSNKKIKLPQKMFTEKYETVRYPYSVIKNKAYSDFGVYMEELVMNSLKDSYGDKLEIKNSVGTLFSFSEKELLKFLGDITESIEKIKQYFEERYPPSEIKKIVWCEEFSVGDLCGHPDMVIYLKNNEVVIFDVKVFSLMKPSKSKFIRMQISCYLSLARTSGFQCDKVGIIMPWRRETPVKEYDIRKWKSEEYQKAMEISTLKTMEGPLHRAKWMNLFDVFNVGQHIEKRHAMDILFLNEHKKERLPPWQTFLYGNNPSKESEEKGKKELDKIFKNDGFSHVRNFMVKEKTSYFYKHTSSKEVQQDLKDFISGYFSIDFLETEVITDGKLRLVEDMNNYFINFGDPIKLYFFDKETDEKTIYLLNSGDLFSTSHEIFHKFTMRNKSCPSLIVHLLSQTTNKQFPRYSFKNSKAYVHAPYNLNLAKSDKYITESMKQYMIDSHKYGFKGVVFHVGHHENTEEGLKQMKINLKKVIKYVNPETPLYLETPCGARNELLPTPEEFVEFISLFPWNKLQVCLDTCHVFVSGYYPMEYIKRMDSFKGRITFIHFNGSRKEKGCGCDGHRPVTKIQNIPDEELISVLKYAKRRKITCVTE